MSMHNICDTRLSMLFKTKGGARNFPTGADSSDEGLEYGFSGYYI